MVALEKGIDHHSELAKQAAGLLLQTEVDIKEQRPLLYSTIRRFLQVHMYIVNSRIIVRLYLISSDSYRLLVQTVFFSPIF